MSFIQRLLQDMKKDRKKTLVMLVLAVGLLGVCTFRVIQGVNKSQPKRVAVETETISPTIESDESPQEEVTEKPRFARFLGASLPYERIGGNPFRAFYLDREEAKVEPEKNLKEKREEDLAREEKSILTTIRVSCVVTGDDACAVVDGIVMQLGDEYKGFVIEEMGDRYVLFVGQTTSRKIHVPF